MFFLATSACVKESNIEIDFSPELVVFSNISPDFLTDYYTANQSKVQISQTKRPDDNSKFEIINDAEINISKIDTRNSQLNFQHNEECNCFKQPNFTNEEKIEEDYTYVLQVDVPGHEILSASTTVPKAVEAINFSVSDFEMNPSIRDEEKINFTYNLNFEIPENNEAEYFHAVFHTEFEVQNDWGNNWRFLYTLNPLYTDELIYTKHHNAGWLINKDNLIPGQKISLKFSDYMFDYHKILNFVIELRTVSKEYYLYHESLSRQAIVRQDPFAEPVTIYNNVKNGYGNFSGFSVRPTFIPFSN